MLKNNAKVRLQMTHNFVTKFCFSTCRSGFTLVELLIAMFVFVLFSTVLFSSYVYIVRAQRDANFERMIYEEAQQIFERFSQDIRLSTVDYECYFDAIDLCIGVGLYGETGTSPGRVSDILSLLSSDGLSRVLYRRDPSGNVLQILRQQKNESDSWEDSAGYSGFQDISSENIDVERLDFFITPTENPYFYENYALDEYQYQPRISIFMELYGRGVARPEGIRFQTQTTFSSRVYNRL